MTTVIIVIWVVVHLLGAFFSMLHQVKYYRYKGWEFDNNDTKDMIIRSLLFGTISWIACCITMEIKKKKKVWKLTSWLNKLVEGKNGV